jgi:hypothetical protein
MSVLNIAIDSLICNAQFRTFTPVTSLMIGIPAESICYRHHRLPQLAQPPRSAKANLSAKARVNTLSLLQPTQSGATTLPKMG